MPSVAFIGTATDYKDLLTKLRTHLTTTAMSAAITPDPGNTGNGGVSLISYTNTSAPQTITLTCTSASADAGDFSVTGSVSGALGTATVGVAFTNANLNFTILDGSVDFAVSDEFVIVTEAWESLKVDTTTTPGSEYNYFRGPGLDGGENIYVNIVDVFDAGGDWHSWSIRGATGFNTSLSFQNQPGSMSVSAALTLWNSSIDYWIVANGRRFIVVAKIAGNFFACYCGFGLPFGTKEEYPYPLLILGSSTTTSNRYSITSYNMSNFWMPNGTPNQYYNIDGGIVNITSIDASAGASQSASAQNFIVPFNEAGNLQGTSEDGVKSLLPAILHITKDTTNQRMELALDGVFAVDGTGAASEDIVTPSGYSHGFLIVQNTYRTAVDEFAAIELG